MHWMNQLILSIIELHPPDEPINLKLGAKGGGQHITYLFGYHYTIWRLRNVSMSTRIKICNISEIQEHST